MCVFCIVYKVYFLRMILLHSSSALPFNPLHIRGTGAFVYFFLFPQGTFTTFGFTRHVVFTVTRLPITLAVVLHTLFSLPLRAIFTSCVFLHIFYRVRYIDTLILLFLFFSSLPPCISIYFKQDFFLYPFIFLIAPLTLQYTEVFLHPFPLPLLFDFLAIVYHFVSFYLLYLIRNTLYI